MRGRHRLTAKGITGHRHAALAAAATGRRFTDRPPTQLSGSRRPASTPVPLERVAPVRLARLWPTEHPGHRRPPRSDGRTAAGLLCDGRGPGDMCDRAPVVRTSRAARPLRVPATHTHRPSDRVSGVQRSRGAVRSALQRAPMAEFDASAAGRKRRSCAAPARSLPELTACLRPECVAGHRDAPACPVLAWPVPPAGGRARVSGRRTASR